jgi:hypothetical protein
MQETTALRELRSRAPVTLASPAQALHIERLVQQVATALEGQRGGCPAGLDGTARGAHLSLQSALPVINAMIQEGPGLVGPGFTAQTGLR